LACKRDAVTGAPTQSSATDGKKTLMDSFKKVVKQQRDELWWTDWDRVLGMIDEIFGATSCKPLLLVGKLLKLATAIGSAGRDEMARPGNRALREMLLQCVLVGMRGALMCTPVEGKTSEWGKIFSVHFEVFSVMYDESMGQARTPGRWEYAPGDWDEETTEAAVRTARTYSSRMGSTLRSYHDSFNVVCALREHMGTEKTRSRRNAKTHTAMPRAIRINTCMIRFDLCSAAEFSARRNRIDTEAQRHVIRRDAYILVL